MAEESFIDYGTTRIRFSIVRRDRRTLEIAIEPDLGVTVAAPRDAALEAIAAKVRKRAAWILRQQRYFSQFVPRRPPRRYVAGETHLYLGRQYRLKVEQHIQAGVTLSRGFIHVRTHAPGRLEVTHELVNAWYRERAHRKFRELLEQSLKRFADPEAMRPTGLIVRSLKQRWGSMSPSGRLLLNHRLIEAPVDAIDYVITHELCHIEEPHHGPAFFALLDRVMPDWEKRKERLERTLS